MRLIALTLSGAVALAIGSAALAQGALAPKSKISSNARTELLETLELTPDQRTQLYQPRGPRPGVYRLRALHSGNCVVAYEPIDGLDRQARLAQIDCRSLESSAAPERFSDFVMLPHPSGGYTLRSQLAVAGGRAAVPGQISNCLTVAPGVVFGPARIELRGCEVPNGAGWDGAGGEGQRFIVPQMASNAWELRIAGGNPESPDCVAARGGSAESRTDYIKWGCTGNADQRFMFEWVRPVPADLEAATLVRGKWFPFADGPHWLSPANGVELMGASYSSFETADDKGDYCMKRCAELGECKAWTWTGIGYRDQTKPMCNWKRDPGRAVNRGLSYDGKVFSGIVR